MQEIVSLRKRYKKMTIQRKWEPVLCMIILAIFWFYFDFLNYLKNSLTDTYKPPMPPHLCSISFLCGRSTFPDEMSYSPQMPE